MKKHKPHPLQLAASTLRPLQARQIETAGGRAVVTDHTYLSMCTITPTVACWP